MHLTIAARKSPLSQAQVREIHRELLLHDPEISFEVTWVDTIGDIDQQTSLRTLGKTDFFTREVDQLLLNGHCKAAIHSAKDLPDPLPEGLTLAALTKGIDPSDSLVMRDGESLESIKNPVIATSSKRREEAVIALRSDCSFIDIRGTIGARLEKLINGEADGVVIAEAALIRLGLTHLNRVRLPGETVEGQGQLAIVVRANDPSTDSLFSCLDSRKKKILYLGLNPPQDTEKKTFVHLPVIEVKRKSAEDPSIMEAFAEIEQYTHLIFTSQTAVKFFFEFLELYRSPSIENKQILSVGNKTTECLRSYGIQKITTAAIETAEGVVDELKKLHCHSPYFFWPHSALSRDLIAQTLKAMGWKYRNTPLYETTTLHPKDKPNLSHFDEIYFTSPSTVDAFAEIFGLPPQGVRMIPIGPVTDQKLIALYQKNG